MEEAKKNLPAQIQQELATTTNVKFLTDYAAPVVQRKYRRINTALAAIESGTPSMASITKRFGEDFTLAYIETWIVNLREFLNVGKKLTDAQTKDTALLILDEYYNVTIADINIIFKRAKLGQWGQIYDRLDGQIILSWFDKYFNERCRAAADREILEADRYKGGSYPRFSSISADKDREKKIGAFVEQFKKQKPR